MVAAGASLVPVYMQEARRHDTVMHELHLRKVDWLRRGLGAYRMLLLTTVSGERQHTDEWAAEWLARYTDVHLAAMAPEFGAAHEAFMDAILAIRSDGDNTTTPTRAEVYGKYRDLLDAARGQLGARPLELGDLGDQIPHTLDSV